MTQVTKTDNRIIAQVAKDIATMRRRVASAVRKHNSLKARLNRLANDNRIVWLHKDAEIVAGVYNVWYVKAESLNPDKDAEWNWYYQVIFVEEHSVYQCSCEDVRQCDCKHAVALGSHFRQEQEQAEVARIVAEAHEDYQRLVAPLNYRNAGFQLLRV